MARAVTLQDLQLANTLLLNSELAVQALSIDGDTVSLSNPQEFARDHDKIRRDKLQQEIDDAQAEAAKSPERRRKEAEKFAKKRGANLRRALKRWSPFGKTVHLVGLTVRHLGSLVRVTNQNEQLSAQTAAWTPTFSRDGDLPHDAEAVARGWSRPWPFSSTRVPTSI